MQVNKAYLGQRSHLFILASIYELPAKGHGDEANVKKCNGGGGEKFSASGLNRKNCAENH